MIRYALIGISHPHISALNASLSHFPDEAVCIGYADTPAHDRQNTDAKIRSNLGAASQTLRRFDDYKELIAQKPELAVICCDNAASAEIACEVMDAGISVALEKPMSSDLASAKKIAASAKQNGVKLAVNWPVAWFPSFNKAKELCDAGKIGRIMRVTYRSPATWGPYSYSKDGQNPPLEKLAETWWYNSGRGGGSILDYACYGAALSTWFFGRRAKAVSGLAKNFCLPGLDVEDFSAMLLDFGEGIGLLEGSWSTFNCGEVPSGPVIHGSEGTIVCDRHSNLVKVYLGRSHTPVQPTEVIECPSSIPGFEFGRNLIDHLTQNKPLHPMLEPEFNLSVMAALDAGRRAAGEMTAVEQSEH